jgi:hypothetical protein
MTFAFLFLTYDNFTHPDKIWEFTKTQNIYIHPKNRELVSPIFRPYIIDSVIETKWGESSIVDATIHLLSESYQSEDNTWFVLLSQDSYPLHSFDTFEKKIAKISPEEKSMFNLKSENRGLSKTSQWWILNRNDVKIILENNLKYRREFQMGKKSDGAFDEFYFLSLLRAFNTMYEFINIKVMYDDFQEGTIQKSPKIFNKLLKYDKNEIEKNESLFIRKVTPKFTMETYVTKRNLIIVYIGTETDQIKILGNVGIDTDLIILSSIKLELIHPDIVVRSICLIQIIYTFVLDTILSLSSSKYITIWDSVLYTTEKYDLSNIYSLETLIEDKLPFDGLTNNPKQFKFVNDKNGNVAFHKDNTKNNRESLIKTHIPRRKFIPNLPTTMRDWESPSYDTPSPVIISTPESPLFTLDSPPVGLINFVDNSTPSPPFIPFHERLDTGPEQFIIPKCVRKPSTPEVITEFVPKRVSIKVKKRKNITLTVKNDSHLKELSNKESPLPNGITIKIGKRCPKGSKTHKYKDKVVCIKVNLDEMK